MFNLISYKLTSKKITLITLTLLLSKFLPAQEKPAGEGLGDAAANAVNPGAFITKVQIQPNFTWKDEKARQLLLNMRIINPSGSIGLPFIKSWKWEMGNGKCGI